MKELEDLLRPGDEMIEVLIHKQQFGNVIGLSVLGGIEVVLVVLALASLRVFGVVIDAEGYAIVASAIALVGFGLFLGLLFYFFWTRGKKRR